MAIVCAALAASCGGERDRAAKGARGGQPRPGSAPVFLSRPALGPEGQIAFTDAGRVWIADSAASGEYRARAVDPTRSGDRPQWLAGRPGLAMSVWFAEQADLAVWSAGELRRLTTTPEDELLADVGPGDELLFERGGSLHVMLVDWGPGGEPQGGAERELTRGRDGRFTPDGKHLLFVRGHETEALGIWRQGYEGGDDSDVYHLDLATLAVTQITDAPGNDELPVPLDNEGRRFIVLRERDGKPYRPWVVAVVSSKVQRVRRLAMPDGEWPLLFPAVEILDPAPAPGDTSLELDLWLEGDGRLYRTRGAVEPKKLAFPPPELVPIHLARDGMAAGDAAKSSWGGLFDQLFSAIEQSPVAGPRLAAIPTADRERFRAAIAGTGARLEPAQLAWRFCGRLGLPGFDGVEAHPEPAKPAHVGFPGVRYVALGDSLASHRPPLLPPGTEPLVLDLRGAGGSGVPTEDFWSAVTAACAGGRPVVALIHEQTWGQGEIAAARLREECAAILVGRRTAGLAMETAAIEISPGSDFPARVPIGQVKLPSGKVLDGLGVFPEVPVGARLDPASEPWPEGIREGLDRALSASRRRGGARLPPP
jgi:Peptidase family S41